MKARKVTLISVMVSLALVLHVVERMIPIPQMVPGVKLGLANIVTLVGIFTLSFSEVILLVVVRTFLGSLFGGGFTAFWFSVSGGLLSMVIMYLLAIKLAGLFSLTAISIVGAVFHNIGQLLIAALLVETLGILYYLPVLAVSAGITGALVGITSGSVLQFLRRRGYVDKVEQLDKAVS